MRNSNIFQVLNDFNNLVGAFFMDDIMYLEAPRRTPQYSVPTFPPSNVFLDKDSHTMTFELAVSGYSREDISISYEDDYMIVEFDKPEQTLDEKDDNRLTLHKGIRSSGARSKYFVPRSKFDVDQATAKLDNGILIVQIPTREDSRPKKLAIE